MRTLLETVDTGRVCVINGANWPIVSTLHRVRLNGRVTYVVTRDLCNGVPMGSSVHKRLYEAKASMHS